MSYAFGCQSKLLGRPSRGRKRPAAGGECVLYCVLHLQNWCPIANPPSQSIGQVPFWPRPGVVYSGYFGTWILA